MRKMKWIMTAATGLAAPALAQVTINVYPASAPNGFGSPSWNGWVSNALYAIENNLSSYGTAGTPTYYERVSGPLDVRENFVTSYPSWRGYSNPGGVWGAGFANELGNRLHFGLHIVGNGTRFSISQLSFVMDSTDSANTLDFTFGLGGYNYSSQYVGIDYGPDATKGTSDDAIITSGPNTQLVDELIGRGSGNAWWPGGSDPDPSNPVLGQQGAIEDARASLLPDTPFLFVGTYTLDFGGGNTVVGSGSVTFVPTPGSFLLVSAGLLAVARRRR